MRFLHQRQRTAYHCKSRNQNVHICTSFPSSNSHKSKTKGIRCQLQMWRVVSRTPKLGKPSSLPVRMPVLCSSIYFYFFIFFYFCLFRAPPVAYGRSRARHGIRVAVAGTTAQQGGTEPHLQPTSQLMAMPARSLTHRGSPGIQAASSWMLAGFLTP